jgi:hypothetical protein
VKFPIRISTTDLAIVLGVNKRTLSKLVDKKVLCRESRGCFDLADAVQAYVAHREGVVAAEHGVGTFGKARAQLYLERARAARIKREELEGILAPVAEMRAAMSVERDGQSRGVSFWPAVVRNERAGKRGPSRPGEFHPEPLTEPDLNLSIHPARAIARRLPPSIELRAPPVAGWPPSMAMTCSLRSTSITLASPLLQSSPPLSGASVLSASRFEPLVPFPWHHRPGSHVPYKSPIELRAASMPDAAWAVSGHPPS